MSSRSRSRRNRSQQKTRNQRRTRNQRKQSRRNHKRSHNHNQRGGMAEWSSAGDYTLIGPDARVSAQVGPLDSAFGELPSVIPQRGGRSHSRNRSRKARRALSRKRNHSRRHNQKGGMAPFGDTGRTLTASQYAADGTNPQFRTEVNVNERYAGF
jgi:hypothetical protein